MAVFIAVIGLGVAAALMFMGVFIGSDGRDDE